MADIIDNRNFRLSEAVKEILNSSERGKFVIGYFFLSGFREIAPYLNNLKELKIVIGNTTTKETLEQLVEGYKRLEEAEEILKRQRFVNRTETGLIFNDTKNNIKEVIEYMDQTEGDETTIKTLSELISNGKVKIRIYTKGRLHAKAYIFDYPENYGYEKGIAIVGSSNLTLSGLTHNTELNVVVHGNENHEQLTKWFNEIWNEAKDFDEELLDILKRSWALNEDITPYDIYIKTIYNLVKDREEIPTYFDYSYLTNFQKEAMKEAIKIIDRFNGVFISDVVGLGKTYIGASLLDYFWKRRREKGIIICPASLKEMWETVVEEFDLNARVLSTGKLSQGNIDLLRERKFRDRNIVLIDESHEFRNTNTNRYKRLSPFTQGRKLILLTATPRCNTVWDIYNQMKLFHPDENITEAAIDPPNMREFFRKVEQGEVKLKELLRNVLIRRTRKHILKWYGEEDEEGKKYVEVGGKRYYFPERVLKTKEYSIEKTYNGLYEDIRKKIKELTLARYNLYEYVYPELRTESPYAELKQAGKSLKGLMRILLFKRFESSVEAFRKTVSNLIELNWILLNSIEEGFIPAGEEAQKYMYEAKSKEEEDFFIKLEELSERYDASAFDVDRLKRDVKRDIEILKSIYKEVERIKPEKDEKLKALKNLIENELIGEKVLIFTEYSDTLNYLYENLKHIEGVEKVDSKRKDWINVIQRFAPKSNHYVLKNSEEEIQILISTDILSQGLNLQDAYIVINYDLHWNPVRLIQRIGRVDRIGSVNEKIYCFNFLPEIELDRGLGLKQRLKRRIQEIHDTIGEDAKILDETEQLNEEAMYAIYRGDSKILDEGAEEEVLSFEEMRNIIRNLEKEDPGYLSYVKNLPDGIRSFKGKGNNELLYIYLKAGDFNKLYLLDKNKEIVSEDIEEVLTFIKCEKDEKIGIRNREIFKYVPEIKRRFEKELKELLSKRTVSRRLSSSQQYILNEMRIVFENTDDEELKNRIKDLTKIFKKDLLPAVQKELREIKKSNLAGKKLIDALTSIGRSYGLFIEEDKKIEDKEVKEDKRAKIICSEGIFL